MANNKTMCILEAGSSEYRRASWLEVDSRNKQTNKQNLKINEC